MNKSKTKNTLADKIADVLKAAPASFDPDDEIVDDTSAKLASDGTLDGDDDNDEQILSKFRKQNVDLLADIDERYAGKKGSRKSFKDESDDDSTDSNAVSDEENSIDDENESEDNEEENDDNSVKESEDGEEQSESEYSEEEDHSIHEDDDDFTHLKENNKSSQASKGLCVKNQIAMWENLLETRIQLQKCLITANKMPNKDHFSKIKQDSGTEFTSEVNDTKKILCSVLDKMLELQTLVWKRYPETKGLEKDKTKEVSRESDEEIPSETEEEIDESEEETHSPKKRRKLDDYEKEIAERHEKYLDYRNSVIEKWNTKTRIAILNNNKTALSVTNQIDHILRDKPKLIKRTQLKRSEYNIVGQESKPIEKEDPTNPSRISTEECNTEIFDDDDFYHQLLRELIEIKSADITDPVQLGRQWIQLQNMRSKMKRKIDTKATKGRKIRYTVHSKLVNYMAPIDDNLWTDEAKIEVYNSLFGKKR